MSFLYLYCRLPYQSLHILLQCHCPLNLQHSHFYLDFYSLLYFNATASHHLMSSYRAYDMSIITHLHWPPPWISTSTFDFTISLTHHNCTYVVILSIAWICLIQSSPTLLLYAACSTLVLLIHSALLKPIHYYCSSSIVSTLIRLLYSVPPYFSPLSFTLLYYHPIFSTPSYLSAISPI